MYICFHFFFINPTIKIHFDKILNLKNIHISLMTIIAYSNMYSLS